MRSEEDFERSRQMEILEKVAYMKGLAEGLGLDTKSKDGKLFTIMMDILDDMALELHDLRTGQEELEDALDAVSDDLSDVESSLYELDDEDEEPQAGGVYQTICPNCGEDIYFDESVLDDGAVECPDCGKQLEFDLDDCGGCCGSCGGDEDEVLDLTDGDEE